MSKKRKRREEGSPPSAGAPSSRAGRYRLSREPAPGASPGTLVIAEDKKPTIALIDYCEARVVEKTLGSIDECIPYLQDETPSITWVDVRGLGDRRTLERMGEIFKIHPLALEDVVNVPQRPHADAYAEHQVVITRMVELIEDGQIVTEQLGVIFGQGFVLTVQEDAQRDCLESVRERIRKGRGTIRTRGADYLAYALLDAVVDGFYPVLEQLGERLEELEIEAAEAPRGTSKKIHDIKRELLGIRRAVWPQRDLMNGLLRDETPHVTKETRIFLRDTYDHVVQVMDMVETFREIASGLMDLYLSGVSNRMNEIMKVLTVISTVFLPMTFIAGVYRMNFATTPRPTTCPSCAGVTATSSRSG
ncbi:MAG: magnesium/cobalt transporter CorA [Byssovorax sp.]